MFRNAVAIATVFLSVILASPIEACECEALDLDSLVSHAVTVVRAEVVGARKKRGASGKYFLELDVEKVQLLKGSAAKLRPKTPFSGAECGAKVTVPQIYWLFLDSKGVFYSCGGAIRAFTQESANLDSRL